jgi:Cyclin, N-terminal domain
MDVGEYFCLHPTTTHAAVAYLDRLHLSKFSRHEWQMLAVSCILIAGEEYDLDPDPDPAQSLACSCDIFLLQIQIMPHLRQLK